VARQQAKQPEPPPPLVITNHFTISGPTDRLTQQQIAAAVGAAARRWKPELCRLPNGWMPSDSVDRKTKADCKAKFDNTVFYPLGEPQVRSRSAAAKSPLNGSLTEQSGRYCGLGFCDEE
jgi:hypothetical protein